MKKTCLFLFWVIPKILFGQTDTMFVELSDGSIHSYSVADINELTFSKEVLSVDELNKLNSIITAFTLKQNYPNPFNPTTTIEYEIPKLGEGVVSIFDIQGRKVRELERTIHDAGNYKIMWDSHNDAGSAVSSGTYFYRVQFNGSQLVNKLLLLK